MRSLLGGAVLAILALCLMLPFLPPDPHLAAQAPLYFSAAEIEQGTTFAQQRRAFALPSLCLQLGWLFLLACSPWGRRLVDRLNDRARGRWILALLLVGGVWLLGQELLRLPFALGSFLNDRSWELTHRSVPAWLLDRGKSLLIFGLQDALLIVGFYWLLRRWPRRWWLPAAGLAALVGVAYAWLMPLVINPLFNTFTPLAETRWADQEPQVRKLAERAGLEVGTVLVMDASRRGRHSNAYFTGFGPTRRIVLYDNLLIHHPPDEVASILAHEMGHWLHDHIVVGLALAVPAALAGLFLLSRLLLYAVDRPPFRLAAPGDPRGLPLLILLATIGSWLALPFENAVSRRFERQADWAALELARDPDAFERAEKRLLTHNLGNPIPSTLAVAVFATHPPAVERLEMAQHWRRIHPP